MPRIYSTTDKTVGGVTIHIRQVLGFGNLSLVTNLVQVIENSQKYVAFVLGLRDPTSSNHFLSYFNPGGTTAGEDYVLRGAGRGKITAVLTAVDRGIRAEHGVKVGDYGSAEGYVSVYPGRAGDPQGEIHINSRNLLPPTQFGNRAITYIHEATHRFAQTKDHADKGYISGQTNTYKAPGLTAQEACDNADSYAWFVWQVCSDEQKRINARSAHP